MKATKQRTIKARVEDPDLRAIAAAATAGRLTVSAWVRQVLLERVAELRARGIIQ